MFYGNKYQQSVDIKSVEVYLVKWKSDIVQFKIANYKMSQD
jgi:hypothetical protein